MEMDMTFNDLRVCVLEQEGLVKHLTRKIAAAMPELSDFEAGPVAVPGDSLGEMLCGAYLICDIITHEFSWEIGFLNWSAETIRFLNLGLDSGEDTALKQRVLRQIEQDLRGLGFACCNDSRECSCLLGVEHSYWNIDIEAVCSGRVSREVIDVMCKAMRLCLHEQATGEIYD